MRIGAWTLSQKVVALVISVIVCLSAALCLNVGVALSRYAEHICIERQSANMRVAWDVLHGYGSDFHVSDGKLYVGTHVLNGDLAAVDKIQVLVGGAATIFMGDERIATNVKKPDGSRAIGTKLAAGPIYDQTLKQGLPYHGEAPILGETYLTAYEPIRDVGGAVIGALFVGIRKSEFFAGIHALMLQLALVTLLVAAVAVAASVLVARRMFRPLDALRSSAERLAEGDFSANIDGATRQDDIGKLAQVLQKHQETSRAKAQAEAESARNQHARVEMEAANAKARREHDANERRALEERVATAAEQQRIVECLATGLEHLSSGQLRHRIDRPFAADYEQLRRDFNKAMQTLSDTLGAIADGAESIRTGTESIRAGTSELSERTRQQASRLATTTSALGRVTQGIQETANAASTTRVTVDAARDAAQKSAAVVRQAIEAMSEIEGSSKQIQQIIGVIDDIAFQTNLLALNAAVEAARAGEQGRGFAVVAAEVRNLASRSSDAAKQIKGLILRSSEQVGSGTALVDATGVALERIATQVEEINDMVRAIDSNAVAQASEVRAVGEALTELDALTQQNNAMVAASTHDTEALAQSAVELAERLQRFELDAGQAIRPQRVVRRRA
jgi:methyl-accepting chemotaxis protein